MEPSRVWGMVGGALVGMGMVAALPVLGPVGGISTLGVLIGAAVGGAGGTAVAAAYEREVLDAYERGQVEQAQKLRDVQANVRRFHGWWGGYAKRVEALMAIGFAAAAVDGPVNDDERAVIGQFVWGVTGAWQHWGLRRRIDQMAKAPPTYADAVRQVARIGDPALVAVVEDVIEMAIRADGRPSGAERGFLDAWLKDHEGLSAA